MPRPPIPTTKDHAPDETRSRITTTPLAGFHTSRRRLATELRRPSDQPGRGGKTLNQRISDLTEDVSRGPNPPTAERILDTPGNSRGMLDRVEPGMGKGRRVVEE